ncbi:MAG TPA: GAF domain-containing protein, partial [Chthonomonadaceae bacterium]|nr:GAF domain-containing protein [Chthonomonadaceae bacterium]
MEHPKPSFISRPPRAEQEVTLSPPSPSLPHDATFREEHARILERIAVGQPLTDILLSIIALLEAETPGAIGSIMLLDETGTVLNHGASLNLPEGYRGALERIPLASESGTCGTAAYRRETIIVPDISTHPLWARLPEVRTMTLGYGLRSCWSAPILSRTGDVLGTFATYYTIPRVPSEQEQQALKVLSHLAAIAIERHHTEQALRMSEERLRLAITGAKLGTWHWDAVRGERIWSDRTLALFGLTETPTERDAWIMLMHPDDREAVQKAVDTAVDNHMEYEQEYRILWPDGSSHWIAFRG